VLVHDNAPGLRLVQRLARFVDWPRGLVVAAQGRDLQLTAHAAR